MTCMESSTRVETFLYVLARFPPPFHFSGWTASHAQENLHPLAHNQLFLQATG